MLSFWYHYKNTLIITVMLLIFFVPMGGAYWLYYKGSYLIKHTTNHGLLIQPSLDLTALPLKALQGATLPETPFKKRWILFAIAPTLDEACTKKLYQMRQIQLMLGKDMNAVQRMLIFYGQPTPCSESLLKPYLGTAFFVMDQKYWLEKIVTPIKEAITRQKTHSEVSDARLFFDGFFIMDTNGQLIMAYKADTNPKGIMQDLRRLINTNRR